MGIESRLARIEGKLNVRKSGLPCMLDFEMCYYQNQGRQRHELSPSELQDLKTFEESYAAWQKSRDKDFELSQKQESSPVALDLDAEILLLEARKKELLKNGHR